MGVEDVYRVGRVLSGTIADRSGRAFARRGRAESLLRSDTLRGRLVDHNPALRRPATEVLAAFGQDVDRTAGARRARSSGDARFVEGLRGFDAIVRRQGSRGNDVTLRAMGVSGPTNGRADHGRR